MLWPDKRIIIMVKEQFKGVDFDNWRFKVISYLDFLGLLAAKSEFKKNDRKVKA